MPIPADIESHFVDAEGFCHPEWDEIAARIESETPEDDWAEAWDEVCLMWLGRLRPQATGDHRIHQMGRCLVLTDAPTHLARYTLTVATQTIQWLERSFPGIFRAVGLGKHVILIFSDMDDYYRYISFFYEDGEHPMSQGICIYRGGYVHTALIATHCERLSPVLVHELTHECLAHLPLPVWINEALAMRVEYEICRTGVPALDKEIFQKHQSHWNDHSIQEFWSGESWQIPGDSFDLAYGLAYILWHKIEADVRTSRDQFGSFLLQVNANDGGQSAFGEVFGGRLSELVEDFLGPGDWEPKPQQWKRVGQIDDQITTDELPSGEDHSVG